MTGNIYEDLNIREYGEHPVTASLAPMGLGEVSGRDFLLVYITEIF